MNNVKNGIWAGVGIVLLAFALMAFVQQFIWVLIVVICLAAVYSIVFKRKW